MEREPYQAWMLELQPPLPETDAFAGVERQALTESLRTLLDVALTAEHATPAEIAHAVTQLDQIARSLGASEAVQDTEPVALTRQRPERSFSDYFPRSPVIGSVHPFAAPLTPHWDAERREFTMSGSLRASHEGPPGYAHGGVLSMIFDEVLGMGNFLAHSPGMTASLNVRYRRPTPLYQPLVFTAHVDRVEGRKIFASATCACGDDITAEAHGVFVSISPELAATYFGAMQLPGEEPPVTPA